MTVLTREELYELVWSDPVRTVAATVGVSDVWLKKACLYADVPVPERGYWAKLQAGKRVSRTSLPPRAPGLANDVGIKKPDYNYRWDPAAELAAPLPTPPIFAEPIEAVASRVIKRAGKVTFHRSLDAPWGAIRKLLERDDQRREKQRNSPWPTLFDAPLFDSPFERRRMRILNSLCMALSKNGARPEIGGKEARDLSVVVGSTRVHLSFDHPQARPNRWGQSETRPGAIDTLRLEIKGRGEEKGYKSVFVDTDDSKLEAQLTEIVIAIIVAGEAQYREGLRLHHKWLIKRRAENEAEVERRRLEAERLARERRLGEEKERRDLLLSQAQAWRTAQDIRGFVADLLNAQPHDSPDPNIIDWARWARLEADAIDPVHQRALVVPASFATSGERSSMAD